MTHHIRKVGIAGAGTMGEGIAQVCAAAGYDVLLFDISPDLPEKALSRVHQNLRALAGKGKISLQDADDTFARLRHVTEINMLQADLIIEAVVEDENVKRNVFRQIEMQNEGNCILTTNTSSIPVTRIGAALTHPGRFAGLHFFNPAPSMKLVEIVPGDSTNDETISTLKDFCFSINKEFVVAQDSPGFIVNRVARHFYLESLKIVEEQVSDFRTVDTLLASAGFRMGPFALMDLIGIDVNLSVSESIFNAFHQEPRFRPSLLQQQKVDAGHLGRKTGEGFYRYDGSSVPAGDERK